MRTPRTAPRTAPRAALRTALAGCLLALTALTGAACSGPADRDTLVVLGPWTGEEGEAFEATLRKLDDGTGHTYTYEGTRSLRETLVAQLEADAPPDVAILNSIGELTEYADKGKLRPLDSDAAQRAYPPWVPTLIVNNRNQTFWVPLKVDLKSLVWSKEATSGDAVRWCLGLASQATSGWPGTDWIEDILLHQAGPTEYAKWATGTLKWSSPEVRRAWETWASLLGRRTSDERARSLQTSYEGPDGDGLLNSGTGAEACTHEHQNAFIRYLYTDDGVRVESSAPFLGGDSQYDDAYEVSGDMAAVFSDNPAAQELVDRLSGDDGRKLWQKKAKPAVRPLFPGPKDPRPDDTIGGKIASMLNAPGRTLCFDASDVMPPQLRDAFYRAVLEYVEEETTPEELTSLLDQLDELTDQNKRKQSLAGICT
ncbi:ABC transporter substrate-binding protein [Streptomyces sp. NPDC058001]|uniref:ABC transporter substrate-binding protein n=1 Tax=Streptomyces sp. NPDC058001 TaxID=3346300 RepID=UPI0036EB1322